MAFRFRESRTVSSDRSYSLVNLVMMFFIFCFVGWVWEVSLAFISEGTFVNRGTLHGPWLPIYGTGGVIILILLKKLRKKPLFEFLAAMVLCGGLEYFSSWYLEKTHGGQRWWDYTGYFSQSQWSYLCRGSADVWFGRFGDRVSAGSCIGQLAESYRYKKAHRCGRRASGVLLCGPGVFGAASEHWCRHHRLQGVGHIASVVAPIRCDA